MSIVKLANFEARPYRIPNQEENTDLTDFVEAAEPVILKKLFGTTLYEAYVAGIAEATPADKWTDLKDGANYTYNGIVYEYKGLINLLVPCIFSMWLEETRDFYTSVGVVMKLNDKSERLSPATRIARAYNDFSRQVGNGIDYFDLNKQGTLYGFMKVNENNYDDWVFQPPGLMNEFGL